MDFEIKKHLPRVPRYRDFLKRICFALIFFPCLIEAHEVLNAEKIPINDLQRFTAVVEHIKSFYVKPVDDSILFENAIRGMLAGLDPHSSYLNVEEFAELKASTSGRFGGLGIEITMEDGFVRVISPYDDTPAQKAGLQAGDLIVRINDTPVKGLTLKQAVDLMRGEKGTDILLTVIRNGHSQPLKISMVRDVISVLSIKAKLLENQYGYVRISQFQSNTAEDLKKSINTLKKQTHNKLKGLILDLRNNPGGILEASVQASDFFLDRPKLKHEGIIVFTKGRLAGSQIKEKAHAGDILNGAPIVVLINSGSASASEIVAGALQDHKRAIIVGTESFGKGSVQTVFSQKEKRGLRLTTALYYTPSGRSIQAKGIKPDIVVENLKIPASSNQSEQGFLSREQDLQGHIENVTVKIQNEEPSDPKQTQKKPITLIHQDYQLYEALNILKGLVLTLFPIDDNQKSG